MHLLVYQHRRGTSGRHQARLASKQALEPRIGATVSLGQLLERPEGLRFGYWRDQDTWGLATGKVSAGL